MFSLWQCNHCQLNNFDDKQYCQACFEKADSLSPINRIMHEQQLLFDGFLRMEFLVHFPDHMYHHTPIPMDIIHLCWSFYKLDIKSLCAEADQEYDSDHSSPLNERRNICHIAITCYKNDEYHMSSKLLSLLIEHKERVDYYHYILGNVLHAWNAYEDAEKHYQLAIEFNATRPNYRYRYGLLLEAQEKYQDALEQFTTAMALNEEEAEYWFECAYCYDKLKDFENSQKHYLETIEKAPDTAKYKYWYGLLLEEHEKYQEALDQFTAASALQEDEKEYVFECAYCYGKLKQFEKAHEFYLKTIEMDKYQTPKYCNFYGQFLCKEVHDYEKAGLYFQKAINVDPQNCSAYYQYAKLWRDFLKDYTKSQEYYLKVFRINDRNYGTHGSYAYLLYLMGEYEQALQHIDTELDISEKNKWAWYYKSLLHRKRGEEDEAQRALNKAVELTDFSSYIRSHLEILKQSDEQDIQYHLQFEQLLKAKNARTETQHETKNKKQNILYKDVFWQNISITIPSQNTSAKYTQTKEEK